MEYLSNKLKQSVLYHWDILCVVVMITFGSYVWIQQAFADIEEQAKTVQIEIVERVEGLEDTIQEIQNTVESNARQSRSNRERLITIELGQLLIERRQLTRAIRGLERLANTGDATANDYMALDDLYADSADLNLQIEQLQGQ